jgi:hypothetical protein
LEFVEVQVVICIEAQIGIEFVSEFAQVVFVLVGEVMIEVGMQHDF